MVAMDRQPCFLPKQARQVHWKLPSPVLVSTGSWVHWYVQCVCVSIGCVRIPPSGTRITHVHLYIYLYIYPTTSTSTSPPTLTHPPQGGDYTLSLLVGDSSIAEDVQYTMGTVTVSHKPREDGSQPPPPAGLAIDVVSQPKKQILHMHRYAVLVCCWYAVVYCMFCGMGIACILFRFCASIGCHYIHAAAQLKQSTHTHQLYSIATGNQTSVPLLWCPSRFLHWRCCLQ